MGLCVAAAKPDYCYLGSCLASRLLLATVRYTHYSTVQQVKYPRAFSCICSRGGIPVESSCITRASSAFVQTING